MKKVIKLKLNERDIDQAIKELEQWKKWLLEKTKEFLTALGEEGIQIASAKFASAGYDGTNDVTCEMEQKDENTVAVIAIGGAVLFIEFGTGVTHPDNHPEKPAGILGRGQYGYGLGKLNSWWYTGDPGTNGEVITSGKHAGEVRTHGNPANMSMYMTVRELKEKFEEIARRVYV